MEFGKEARDPPLLEWGDRPEFRAGTSDGKAKIFVAREGADWWRIRYQIAHEVFHWLCGPHVFHWTHEFFAVELAVRAMDEIGEHDYARRLMVSLSEEAEHLSLSVMLTTPLGAGYPRGLYGRAWLSGRSLIEAVGWERLKPLADCFAADGSSDLLGWIRSLPEAEQSRVTAVLDLCRA